MFRLPRKVYFALTFLFFLLFFLSILFIFSPKVAAANIAQPTPNPQDIFYPDLKSLNQSKQTARQEAQSNNEIVVNQQDVGHFQLQTLMYNLSSSIACVDPNTCVSQQTALGNLAQLMDLVYVHPPASGLAYVADVLANANLLAKPAYAQGIGFAGLTPLLPLWKTTRNIAYALIVIIMLIIGFMIIFRMKIDPKTIISVQAALPKIILTLIIITFSYAIVGFLIDLMYLVMAIIINIFTTAMEKPELTGTLQTNFMTGGIFQLFRYVFGVGFYSLDDLAKNLWGVISGGGLVGGGLGALNIIFSGATLPWLLGAITGVGAISLLLLLLIILGLLFTFIRLAILLFNSYIQILVALILGPLQLLTEAIPGKSTFTGWLMNIIANLSVFPTAVALILFGTYLVRMPYGANLWMPPLTGFPAPLSESTATQNVNFFTTFLGLAVVFISPSLVVAVKKMFGPKPMLPVSPGTFMAPLTGSFQTVMGAGQTFYYGQSMYAGLKGLIGGKVGGTTHKIF